MLRQTVAQRFSLPEEMIIAGNGAIELLYICTKVLQCRTALIPAPTFSEYEAAVRINDGSVIDFNLDEKNGFVLDIHELFESWTKADVLFICNPNNPTGVLTPQDIIHEIVREAAKNGKYVVVDEAFMDFVPDREQYTVTDLVKKYDNLIVLYSLTKFYAIPGLRLGVGFANPQLIERMNQIRDPWNVNCFAQIGGAEAVKDRSYYNKTIEFMNHEKKYLFTQINGIDGFEPLNPSVNYILINVAKTGYTAAEITELLGQQRILVRDCSTYKNISPFYIRVAVKNREENNILIGALKRLERKGIE